MRRKSYMMAALCLMLAGSLPAYGAAKNGPGVETAAQTSESTEGAAGAEDQTAESGSLPAEAAQTSELYTAVDGYQIPQAELADSVIHYEELGSLIHTYNQDIRDMIETTEKNRTKYSDFVDYLLSERAAYREAYGEADSADEASEYKQIMETYANAIHSYNKQLKKLDSYSGTKSRISSERTLTIMAQKLMISWQSAKVQEEIMETMEEMYAEAYKNTQLKAEVGSATANDLLSAESSYLNAQANHLSVQSGQQALYRQLCILLGVDETGSMQLADIPAPDRSLVTALDLEADTQEAINNNASYSSYRQSAGSSTSLESDQKTLNMEDQETSIRLSMQELYQTVLQADQALEAAENAYQAALIRWNTAELQYSMGSLSRQQYLAQKLTYLQKYSTRISAQLDLRQALEDYHWAVLGIM